MKLFEIPRNTKILINWQEFIFKQIDWWYARFETFIWFSPIQEVEVKEWVYSITIDENV